MKLVGLLYIRLWLTCKRDQVEKDALSWFYAHRRSFILFILCFKSRQLFCGVWIAIMNAIILQIKINFHWLIFVFTMVNHVGTSKKFNFFLSTFLIVWGAPQFPEMYTAQSDNTISKKESSFYLWAMIIGVMKNWRENGIIIF